jgi:hypothetical protein
VRNLQTIQITHFRLFKQCNFIRFSKTDHDHINTNNTIGTFGLDFDHHLFCIFVYFLLDYIIDEGSQKSPF